jgi:hypothetical protein
MDKRRIYKIRAIFSLNKTKESRHGEKCIHNKAKTIQTGNIWISIMAKLIYALGYLPIKKWILGGDASSIII